ncbi:MAG: ABC transporter ATP-binding protein [Planctomycetota bacterium]
MPNALLAPAPPRRPPDTEPLKTMSEYFDKLRKLLDWRDVRHLTRMVAVVLCLAFIEIAGVFSILPFMQVASNPDSLAENRWLSWMVTSFPNASNQSRLIAIGCCVLIIQVLSAVLNIFSSWVISRATWSTAHRISMRLLQRYARLPYEFFVNADSHALVRKAIADIQGLASGVLKASGQFLAAAFKSLVLLGLLLVVNPALATIAFVFFATTYLIIHLVRHRRLVALGEERLAATTERLRWFTQTLSGIKTLRIDGALPWFMKQFEVSSKRFIRLHPTYQLLSVFPRVTIELFAFGGLVVLVLFLLLTEVPLITFVPTLTLFAMATYKLLPAISQAFTHLATISHNLPVINAMHEDLHEQFSAAELLPTAKSYAEVEPLPVQRQLELREVSFCYANATTPVLQDVNLTISKGSHVALVGSTGCGKSTLIDIMVGLHAPTSGELLVDDTVISNTNVHRWQKRIAYVPQEVFLYDDTIAANIALGIGEIDFEQLNRAIRLAQLEDLLQDEMREGAQTLIGERGVRLSGGQRQRIGLARAFYRQPDVLFLDEATSALDNVTEEKVISGIAQEHAELTVIMVAHRLSSVKTCDRVLLVEAGRVVDEGSFVDLLARNSSFRRMVEVTE